MAFVRHLRQLPKDVPATDVGNSDSCAPRRRQVSGASDPGCNSRWLNLSEYF